MAEKQRAQAPSGMAGLVRYYEEEDSLIKLKPVHVLGICVSFVFLEIMLFAFLPV
jgi:preprotein translocase subunit Sec61beta